MRFCVIFESVDKVAARAAMNDRGPGGIEAGRADQAGGTAVIVPSPVKRNTADRA